MSRLRPAAPHEHDRLTQLCLRSKAHWGYDAAFMAACRDELTLVPDDFSEGLVMVCVSAGSIEAMAQLVIDGSDSELDSLYVDPDHMGKGHGSALMRWAVDEAVRRGARTMRIDADPPARGFYERFGAALVGESPSGSIPGRMLPRLEIDLRQTSG